MRSPTCDDVTLVISSREGIEIDHCPECRGVWLDRGELDKIIDRAAPSVVGASSPAQERPREERRDDRDRYDDRRYQEPRYQEPRYEERRYDDRDRYREDKARYDKRKKKRGFLEDLFDFD
jgi:Zn-finger nucleic acid-binding protein